MPGPTLPRTEPYSEEDAKKIIDTLADLDAAMEQGEVEENQTNVAQNDALAVGNLEAKDVNLYNHAVSILKYATDEFEYPNSEHHVELTGSLMTSNLIEQLSNRIEEHKSIKNEAIGKQVAANLRHYGFLNLYQGPIKEKSGLMSFAYNSTFGIFKKTTFLAPEDDITIDMTTGKELQEKRKKKQTRREVTEKAVLSFKI